MCSRSDDKEQKSLPMTEDDKKDMEKFNQEFEKKKGELSNGPISTRSCTDCLCCLIFVVAIGAFFAASYYGYANGNPENLIIGWDEDGRGCGYSEETKDYPYLYWPEPPSDTLQQAAEDLDVEAALQPLKKAVCVKECPVADSNVAVQCMPTSYTSSSSDYEENGCVYLIDSNFLESWGIDVSAYTEQYGQAGASVAGALKYPYRYDTKNQFGYCMPYVDPDKVTGMTEQAESLLDTLITQTVLGDQVAAYVSDIFNCWRLLLICTVTAVILGYLYLFVIRCIGGLIVWFSIIIVLLGLIAGAGYTYVKSDELYDPSHDYNKYMKWGAYTLAGMAGAYALCVCCCWNAIKLGIAVYKTTAKYIGSNMHIFALPAISYVQCLVWLSVWVVSAIYVMSVGTPEPRENYEFTTEMKWTDQTRYIFFFQIFMLFWVNAFLMGMTQFIIGASACIWYFESNSDTGGKGTVGRAMYWGYRFHMGSVAFGSFMIAVCQLLRFLFEYYRKKIQSMAPTKIVKAIMCVTRYLLYILEKCVKYMTKNAYIQVALTNENFCVSAWAAFALIIKNAHRYGWGNSIGFALNWFGICSIAAVNSFSAYMALTNMEMFTSTVTQPLVPTVVIALVTVLIARSFLDIFSFSSDAILGAFLLDEELRFAGGSRPEYMQDFADQLKNKGKGCC